MYSRYYIQYEGIRKPILIINDCSPAWQVHSGTQSTRAHLLLVEAAALFLKEKKHGCRKKLNKDDLRIHRCPQPFGYLSVRRISPVRRGGCVCASPCWQVPGTPLASGSRTGPDRTRIGLMNAVFEIYFMLLMSGVTVALMGWSIK
jgi:hypothetical protein